MGTVGEKWGGLLERGDEGGILGRGCGDFISGGVGY